MKIGVQSPPKYIGPDDIDDDIDDMDIDIDIDR